MRALKIEDTNADVYSAILSQRKYFCLTIFDVDSLFFFFFFLLQWQGKHNLKVHLLFLEKINEKYCCPIILLVLLYIYTPENHKRN